MNGALTTAILVAFIAGWFVFGFVAIIALISSLLVTSAYLKARLFPLVSLGICHESRVLNWEVLSVILTGLMAFGTIATAIIQAVQIAGPSPGMH